MIRKQPGSFRTWLFLGDAASGANLEDNLFAATATPDYAQWTTGGTLIDRVDFLRPQTDKAMIIGFTVSARVSLYQPTSATHKAYGKFGKIVTGVSMQSEPTQTTTLPYVAGVQNLPSDLSLIADLWNPTQNDLPPTIDPTNVTAYPGLQVGVVQTLPQPIPLIQGTVGVTVGLWMLPSLLAATPNIGPVGNQRPHPSRELSVFNAAYSIVYDDGVAA